MKLVSCLLAVGQTAKMFQRLHSSLIIPLVSGCLQLPYVLHEDTWVVALSGKSAIIILFLSELEFRFVKKPSNEHIFSTQPLLFVLNFYDNIFLVVTITDC